MPFDALSRINYVPDSPGSALDEIVRSILKKFEIDELVEKVSGDNEKLMETARKWRSEATELRGVVEDLQAERKTLQRSWTGPASKAFGLVANSFETALLGEADDMDTTAELLELAALECAEAERLMLDLVVELVQSVMATAATAAVLSLITAGASAALGAVIAGANVAHRATRGIRIAARLAERLSRLSRRMQVVKSRRETRIENIEELKDKTNRTEEETRRLKELKEQMKRSNTVIKKGAKPYVREAVKTGLDVDPVAPVKEAVLGDEDPEITEKREAYEKRPPTETFEERVGNPGSAPQRSVKEAFG